MNRQLSPSEASSANAARLTRKPRGIGQFSLSMIAENHHQFSSSALAAPYQQGFPVFKIFLLVHPADFTQISIPLSSLRIMRRSPALI
jgi:hypothetical protein